MKYSSDAQKAKEPSIDKINEAEVAKYIVAEWASPFALVSEVVKRPAIFCRLPRLQCCSSESQIF